MFTEHYYGFEPDENYIDSDEYVDEEVVDDHFDEDRWDAQKDDQL